MRGYKKNSFKSALTWLVILATAGLLGLPLYWWQRFWIYCTHERCSLAEATMVLVVVSRMCFFIFTLQQVSCFQDHYKGLHTTYYGKNVQKKVSETNDILVPLNGSPEYEVKTCHCFITT